MGRVADPQRSERGQPDERRRGIRAFLIFTAVTLVLVLVSLWVVGWDKPLAARKNPETEDAYADGEYTPLAPRVEGYLRRMDVDDNRPVRAGQVIAELEDSDFRAAVAQAEADLEAARAAVAQVREQQRVLALQIRQTGDQAGGTRAEQVRAAEEAGRQAVLLPTAVGLRRQYDSARSESRRLEAQLRSQEAQREERRRELAVLAAQQARAEANVELRQAQLELARIRLSYTVLRAPADGMVGARQVRVGTLLEPGTEVAPLTPLDRVWFTASFTERQLTDIRPGQPARVRLDAYPTIELAAHVAGISPLTGGQLSGAQGDNATGNYTKVVQRVPVKLTVDPDEIRLRGLIRPGMSALVRVLTDGTTHVRPAR